MSDLTHIDADGKAQTLAKNKQSHTAKALRDG